MTYCFKFFGVLFLFFSLFISNGFAESLELSSEYNTTLSELSALDSKAYTQKDLNPEELKSINLSRKKNEIYSYLIDSLIQNKYQNIDSEIKEKLFKIFDIEQFRKHLLKDKENTLSIYFTLEHLYKNEILNQNYNEQKKSVSLQSGEVASIYFITGLKNNTNLPSLFFRVKKINPLNNKSHSIFSKYSGGRKLVKMVVGYPDMNIYALSTPSMKSSDYFSMSYNLSEYARLNIASFINEKNIHQKIINHPKFLQFQSNIQELLYSDWWDKGNQKLSRRYVTIQPFYEGESFIDFHNFLYVQSEKKYKLLFKNEISKAEYTHKLAKNYSIMLEQFNQTAQALHFLSEDLKLIHMDVKLDNFFIDKKTIAKISDFDSSKIYSNENNDQIQLTVVSNDYIAPECKRKNGQFLDPVTLKKCDIYSFGQSMLNSFKFYAINRAYYSSLYDRLTVVLQSENIFKISQNYPFYNPFLELIDQTMHINPNLRPSFEQISLGLKKIQEQTLHTYYLTNELGTSFYKSNEETYTALIKNLTSHSNFPFPNKTFEQWKKVFTFDPISNYISINTPQSGSKKIIYVDPNNMQSIFDEINFLYELGRFSRSF